MYEPACILLNKPSGLTSFQFLGPVKKRLGEKRIGHTGTLDKFAEGLMLVLVGQATRLARYFELCNKRYRAEVMFGFETDTLDPEGRVIAEANAPSEHALRSALGAFRGSIEQYPPQFSAVHVQGARAYKLARSGAHVAMKPRTVHIHRLELLSFETVAGSAMRECVNSKLAHAVFDIHCSKGSYIRSLARDLARSLGSRAHVWALKRTAIESWCSDNALYLNEFLALDDRDLWGYALRGADLLEMIPCLEVLRVGAHLAEALRKGSQINVADLPSAPVLNTSAYTNAPKHAAAQTQQKLLGILDPNGKITAILEQRPNSQRLQYHSVFPH